MHALSVMFTSTPAQTRLMKRFHIAISTDKINEIIEVYPLRLGRKPSSQVDGEYALCRTDTLSLSIRYDKTVLSARLGTLVGKMKTPRNFHSMLVSMASPGSNSQSSNRLMK